MNSVGILLGNPYGYFGSQATYPTGSGSAPYALAVGDLNKDNRLDITTAGYGTNNVKFL
jgi:hypothetical protein